MLDRTHSRRPFDAAHPKTVRRRFFNSLHSFSQLSRGARHLTPEQGASKMTARTVPVPGSAPERPPRRFMVFARRDALYRASSETRKAMSSLKIRPRLRLVSSFTRLMTAALIIGIAVTSALGQGAVEPRRDQLLNGLRVLMVHRPADTDVLVRLRVHSGAAFDLAGKEGMMSLLAATMFNEEDFRFVEEDLGGRLQVSVDYDAINVTATATAKDFDRLIAMLRSSLADLQLTPDLVAAVRAERVKRLSAEQPNDSAVADRTVAARLFLPHPYSRSIEGTPESVARIEYADLHLARERFLNPNNTTLVIFGRVEPRAVMRLLRQSLGGWRKSDRIVPATFRRPEAAEARTLVVNRPGSESYELRLAVAGLARTDRDRAAADLLAAIVRERLTAASPELRNAEPHVKHESFRDGGIFLLSARAGSASSAARTLADARGVLQQLASQPVSQSQLDAARQTVAAKLSESGAGDAGASTIWLDAHTYGDAALSGASLLRAVNALTPAEIQRVASRLFANTHAATVAVGDAERLRAEMAAAGGVEVFGEAAEKSHTPTPPPAATPKGAQKQPALQLKRPR